MAKAVIVSAARTAIGTLGGALAQQPATKLGAIAVKEAISRAKIQPGQVDEVILGNVLSAGLGLNPSRVAELEGGLPKEVPVYGVNKACGSGLKAVALAAQSILLGDADVLVAGGMESMSGAPYIMKKARFGVRMGHDTLLDSMIADGLTCPITLVHMGVTAENIAAKYGISRDEDEFAAKPGPGGRRHQVGPVQGRDSGRVPGAERDVHLRHRRASAPGHQKDVQARPAFKPEGASSRPATSGINDGAAALVVMSDAKAKELGLTPLATIRLYAPAGVTPPSWAWVRGRRAKALAKAGLRRKRSTSGAERGLRGPVARRAPRACCRRTASM
jgi:acetyl-CoA C-acetyltransferase